MTVNQPTTTKIISAQKDSIREHVNPINMVKNLWGHRELIRQFTKRQILQQYKGSFLGGIWTFVTPLLMLAVYTFAFSVGLKGGNRVAGGQFDYVMRLFAGLIVFEVFSSSTSAAPGLIIANNSYVKRVVFPLEILPVSRLSAGLVNSFFSTLILIIGIIILLGQLHWTIILLPFVYLPLILFCLGLSWFLASLGVFIRDIPNFLGPVVRMSFFLTPIIFTISAIPENLRFIIYVNPLTYFVTQYRQVVLWGEVPSRPQYLGLLLFSFIICLGGYVWFMKSKKAFADVI